MASPSRSEIPSPAATDPTSTPNEESPTPPAPVSPRPTSPITNQPRAPSDNQPAPIHTGPTTTQQRFTPPPTPNTSTSTSPTIPAETMADYSLLVKNKSGIPRAYFVFVEAPEVGSGARVFQNVYVSAPTVATGNGTAAFQLKKTFYGVCGTNSGRALGSNVTVITGDWEVAKIHQAGRKGSNLVMTAGDGGRSAMFNDEALAQDCETPGSFSIECDNTFSIGNGAGQFIGLGAQDPMDPTNIVPVAVFEAQPGTKNIITPKTRYYISWGTFQPGQIIDVKTIAEPAEVDFSGKSAQNCKVVHNDNGTWSLQYY